MGVVFQDFKIIPHWSVFDNVPVALEILELPSRLVRSRVAEALERVGLGGRGADRAGNLSGGEQQSVAIARAIVSEPALLIADEPTGNLDPTLPWISSRCSRRSIAVARPCCLLPTITRCSRPVPIASWCSRTDASRRLARD